MARNSDKGDAKTVKDVKRGKAAEDHQVPINGEDDGARPNFTPSGETVEEYLATCIRIFDENQALDDKIRTKTTPERDAKKKNTKHVATMEKKLAGDGYDLSALQVLKRQAIFKHKAELAVGELAEDQRREHKRMEAAWKSFSDLPLGQAAEAREAANVH